MTVLLDKAERPAREDAAGVEGRLAARLSVRFMLELLQIRWAAGTVLDALLFAGVVHANLARVGRDPSLQLAYARLDSPPPDGLRRPVSINAVAASLNQPFETVRRRINRMIAAGLLVQTPNGVYAPTEVIGSPRFTAAAQLRYAHFCRLHADAQRLGLSESAPPAIAPDDPRAPVRAIDRILMDYAFRTLEVVQRIVRDPLTALVLLGIVRANLEHVSSVEALETMRAGGPVRDDVVPARLADISRRVGVPYETTRRHVAWLIEQGFCRRQTNGIVCVREALDATGGTARGEDNLGRLKRTLRQASELLSAVSTTRPPTLLDP